MDMIKKLYFDYLRTLENYIDEYLKAHNIRRHKQVNFLVPESGFLYFLRLNHPEVLRIPSPIPQHLENSGYVRRIESPINSITCIGRTRKGLDFLVANS